jgi:uncharacterized protein with GYD domain
MPKYLLEVSLSKKGLQGTLKEGGTARRAVAETLVKSVGGKLESFYYAFGDRDVFALIDVPDNASAARVATAVTASGAGSVKTTVLLSPKEIDQIGKSTADYRPPGA